MYVQLYTYVQLTITTSLLIAMLTANHMTGTTTGLIPVSYNNCFNISTTVLTVQCNYSGLSPKANLYTKYHGYLTIFTH